MKKPIMNFTADLTLNKKAFCQQKQLLIELQYALSKKYGSGDLYNMELYNMMEGIIQIFDTLGDAAEAQHEFMYPKCDFKTGKFIDDDYNNVFEKLTGHSVHELEK